jgi:hypothetical protein
MLLYFKEAFDHDQAEKEGNCFSIIAFVIADSLISQIFLNRGIITLPWN